MKKRVAKSILLGIGTILFYLPVSSAFAEISDCKSKVDIKLSETIKMTFCEIPAAQGVLIGDDRRDDEKPVKGRNFSSFQIGQFEVTQAQYKLIMGEEPWKGEEYVQENDNNPAVYVNYFGAKDFADILSRIDVTALYRLPTEAEFEYAARAGTRTDYYWGDEFSPVYAYYSYSRNTVDKDLGYAHSVVSCPNAFLDREKPGYCANSFGLMHMLGNVWEWTLDAYVANYVNAPVDGHVSVVAGAGSFRVLRGGGWYSDPEYLRSADRYGTWPGNQNGDIGFRLVRILRK